MDIQELTLYHIRATEDYKSGGHFYVAARSYAEAEKKAIKIIDSKKIKSSIINSNGDLVYRDYDFFEITKERDPLYL